MNKALATIAAALALACLAPARVSPAEEVDAGESIAEIEAATSPELKQFDQEKRETVRRREQRRKEQGRREPVEPLDDAEREAMLARVPGGPAFLGDLRGEAAEERGQIVEQNIRQVGERRTDPNMSEFVMEYLREVYYRGNASTDVGPFVKKVLETPDGWKLMPWSRFGPLPRGIAGLYDGNITLAVVSMVVYSHELLHHLGHGEPGAYAFMGREFGGGGLGDGSDLAAAENEAGGGDYSFQCSM